MAKKLKLDYGGGNIQEFPLLTMDIAKVNELSQSMGSTQNLNTTNKTNLVSAINEVKSATDGKPNIADIEDMVDKAYGGVDYCLMRMADGTYVSFRNATIGVEYFKNNYNNIEELYSLGSSNNLSYNYSAFKNCINLKKIHSKYLRLAGYASSFANMFNECKSLEEYKGSIDTLTLDHFGNTFNYCLNLKLIGDLTYNVAKHARYDNMFSRCETLETIEGLIEIGLGNTSGMFYSCIKLSNILKSNTIHKGFTIDYSPLTADSVKVILSALKINDAWVSGQSYEQYDEVIYNGKRYYCNIANTDTEWTIGNWVETPSTITFKSGLYTTYTEAEKSEIDTLVANVVAKGWTIKNMN